MSLCKLCCCCIHLYNLCQSMLVPSHYDLQVFFIPSNSANIPTCTIGGMLDRGPVVTSLSQEYIHTRKNAADFACSDSKLPPEQSLQPVIQLAPIYLSFSQCSWLHQVYFTGIWKIFIICYRNTLGDPEACPAESSLVVSCSQPLSTVVRDYPPI